MLDDGVLRVGVMQTCTAPLPDLPGQVYRVCLDGDPRHAVEEARRLVEAEDVDVILAYPDDDEGYALALYVRSQPDKTLVLGSSALQATTLDLGAPNVFRFVPDAAQSAAGLGTYAYEELGWRTAAILREQTQHALEQAHAVAAEFCALGGSIVRAGGDGTFALRGHLARANRVVATVRPGDAAEALRNALRAVSFELSDEHAGLREHLGRGLDESRQAIVEVRLVERRRTVRVFEGVEQTFGGVFTPETSPPEDEPECERHEPPPWSR